MPWLFTVFALYFLGMDHYQNHLSKKKQEAQNGVIYAKAPVTKLRLNT